MLKYIIASTLKLLVVTITILYILNDRKDEEYYKNINQTILGSNVINMYLIIMEGNYGAIDADDSTCHIYYIMIFSPSPYTLQADLSIYG